MVAPLLVVEMLMVLPDCVMTGVATGAKTSMSTVAVWLTPSAVAVTVSVALPSVVAAGVWVTVVVLPVVVEVVRLPALSPERLQV